MFLLRFYYMLSRAEENYLRIIYDLSKKGTVRPSQISKLLRVAPSSVTEMLHKLASKGLINYKKRSCIDLTEDGLKTAKEIYEKYTIFMELFLMAGLSPSEAYEEACSIEHHLSYKTAVAISDLIKRWEKTQFCKRFK